MGGYYANTELAVNSWELPITLPTPSGPVKMNVPKTQYRDYALTVGMVCSATAAGATNISRSRSY
jgi:hypothetical protein